MSSFDSDDSPSVLSDVPLDAQGDDFPSAVSTSGQHKGPHANDNDVEEEEEEEEVKVVLARTMGPFGGISVVVGIMIGSGIFAAPGVVLQQVGSIGLAFVCWAAAGLLSMVGALCYAELGTSLPHAGGELKYLQVAYGDAMAFSFAFTNFFVLKCGSHAIIATIFARYLGAVILGVDVRTPNLDDRASMKFLAVACIVLLNAINSMGVQYGVTVQKVFLVMKLVTVTLVTIVGLGALITGNETGKENLGGNAFAGSKVQTFAPGMIAALWAYDGWNNLNYLSEEIQNPNENLKKVIVWGVSSVTVFYILVNLAYVCVLDENVVLTSAAIGVDFANEAIGSWAGTLMAVMIAFSAFGSCNGSILTGGRLVFAFARDGFFPRPLAKLSSANAPVRAHITQTIWACLILLPFDYESLVNFFGSGAYVFYGAAGLALIVLRRTHPDLERPYLVPLYPVSPIVLVLVSLALVIDSLVENPVPVVTALSIVALSFPLYAFCWTDRCYGPRSYALACVRSLAQGQCPVGQSAKHRRVYMQQVDGDDSLALEERGGCCSCCGPRGRFAFSAEDSEQSNRSVLARENSMGPGTELVPLDDSDLDAQVTVRSAGDRPAPVQLATLTTLSATMKRR